MKRISDDLTIFAEGNPSNQAIIFLHGFPYDSSMWSKQINELKEHFYCITYDIRGLGKSAVGHGQFTMETFVDDLFALIEEIKPVKPVICGLSMGGYIALRAVEREQAKFKAVILCDTKAEADDNTGRLKRAAGMKNIDTDGIEKFVNDFIPNCFSHSFIKNHPAEYNSIIERAAQANPVGVKGAMLAMLARTDTAGFLHEIRIPALVVCGEHDKLSPPEQMKSMAAKIPGSVFKEIPNAAHMTPIENPAEFNKTVLSFILSI